MKIYNVGIDLKRAFTDVLRGIVQNEDVTFKTVISDDGKPIDYSTCNIIMVAVRMPDYTTEKTLETVNIVTANAKKGIVEFKLPKEFTEQEGVHQLQIAFFDKGNMVKTARFNYCVEDGLLLDEPSETEIVTTEDLLRKASEALVTSQEISSAEGTRIAAEELRSTAEEARISNELERKTAETLREEKELARGGAEADRKEAEDIRLENEADRIENEAERYRNEEARVESENKRNSAEALRQEQIERLMYYGSDDISPSEGFTFNENKVTGYNGAEKNVVIPYKNTDGKIITIIDAGALMAKNIKSVTIPSSVQKIGDSAFENCFELEKVAISKGLKTIGVNAFISCKKLKEITIPESVTEIGGWAFSEIEGLIVACAQGSETDRYCTQEWGIPVSYYKLLPVDLKPVENSKRLITSGGVYAAIGDIEASLENIINKYGLGGEA